MREALRQRMVPGMLEEWFKNFDAGHSSGVILSKCKQGVALRIQEISDALEIVEQDIHFELAVDEKTGIIAVLLGGGSMSDTHYIAILLKEHLLYLDLLTGPLIIASFENVSLETALAGMVQQLNGCEEEGNPILIYTSSQLQRSGTILVVDNDELNCELIRNVLNVKGFNVYSAHDGQQGLRRIRELSPTLIITELMLPFIDGFQLIKSVREDYQGKIMVLTGKRLEADIAKCFDLGAEEYMMKPFSPVELEARIRKLL